MTTKRKIWLGVGVFVVGSGAAGAGTAIYPSAPGEIGPPSALTPAVAPLRSSSRGFVLAQHADHAAPPAADKPAGEGGEQDELANLPPDLAFGARIALLRGHLLVGDELVRQRQWNAALPHFLHPTEEIYANIKDALPEYHVPAFDTALSALADVVKARKGGDDYARAVKTVSDALALADAGMKQKHGDDWPSFVTEAAVEAIKSATNEYKEAIVGGKIAKPVEYQDARGFIWEGERMIEGVSAALAQKDAASLKAVRARLAELKKVFPTAVPPHTPVKDHAAVLAIVSNLELVAAKLM